MSAKIIYRGYEIINHKGGWQIYHGDKHVAEATSEDRAYQWIDKKHRELREAQDGPR